MKNQTTLTDGFGQHYSIHLRGDPNIQGQLENKRFSGINDASSFVASLKKPESYWHDVLLRCDGHTHNGAPIEESIGDLLWTGKIKLFPIQDPTKEQKTISKRTVKKQNASYQFTEGGNAKLAGSAWKGKTFKKEEDAKYFIAGLGLDKKQLKGIIDSLDFVALPPNGANDMGVMIETLAKSMAKGDIAVKIDDTSSSVVEKKAEVEETNNVGARPIAAAGGVIVADESTADEQTEPACTCSITSFTVQDKQKRKSGKENILQIVPSPTKAENVEYELMGIKLAIKEEFGGEEKIKCSLSLMDRKSDDCYKITDKDGKKQTGNLLAIKDEGSEKREDDSKWLINASPETYTIEGSGCNGSKTVTIEKYPSNYHTVQGNIDIFQEWVKGVNSAWEDWGKKFFALSPVELAPKLTGPSGTFSANWGWKENSDWKAYYHVSAKFGLDPILGVELAIKLSLMQLVGTLAGIPPAATKILSEHLIDIIFSLGGDCKGSISGEPNAKFYPNANDVVDGAAKFTIDGGLTASINGRAGSKYIVSADLLGAATARIKGEDTVELSREGVFLQTVINLSPFVGTFTVTYKYFNLKTVTKTSKWEPWNEIKIYESDKTKLFPKQ